MPAIPIRFFREDSTYRLPQKRHLKAWLFAVIQEENKALAGLNYILCSDEYLLEINKQYLNHDYYTDIISFDTADGLGHGLVAGDIFISIDRVRDNAKAYQTKLFDELCRVMVHGALHLCGYGDNTAGLKKKMRLREDYYLGRRYF